jgi:hypothetical protein
MTFAEWCESEKGRVTRVAEHFGLGKAAISLWKVRGVPLEHMRAVVALSCGALTLDDLVPRETAKTE